MPCVRFLLNRFVDSFFAPIAAPTSSGNKRKAETGGAAGSKNKKTSVGSGGAKPSGAFGKRK